MSLDWSNERYVRVYTRDTTTWKLCDWRARTVLLHLFRKVDRSGVLDVGDDGVAGLAAVLELPLEEIVEPGIAQLVKRGTVERTADAFVLPNFIEAQEMPASDAQRQRVQREKRRADKRNRDASVTNRDASVTTGHATSRDVTPNRSDPIQTKPNQETHTHLARVNSAAPAPVPPPPCPRPDDREVHALVDRALSRMDEVRRELDPSAMSLRRGSGGGERERAIASAIRSLPVEERERRIMGVVDVLIAQARPLGRAGVGKLTASALTSSKSLEWLLDQTPESVSAMARAGPSARSSPKPATGLAAFLELEQEEARDRR